MTEMSKTDLRAACKAAGVKNYSKMTNDDMRAALAAVSTPADDHKPVAATESSTPKPKRVPAEVRNGVKRPGAGGKCAAVWDALDRDVEAGQQPDAKRARELAVANGWNVNNAICELYVWRKFHGVSGRVKSTA